MATVYIKNDKRKEKEKMNGEGGTQMEEEAVRTERLKLKVERISLRISRLTGFTKEPSGHQ